jgi:hypothetical protein
MIEIDKMIDELISALSHEQGAEAYEIDLEELREVVGKRLFELEALLDLNRKEYVKRLKELDKQVVDTWAITSDTLRRKAFWRIKFIYRFIGFLSNRQQQTIDVLKRRVRELQNTIDNRTGRR